MHQANVAKLARYYTVSEKPGEAAKYPGSFPMPKGESMVVLTCLEHVSAYFNTD